MSARAEHRAAFVGSGGSEEQFALWWRTRSYEPGGAVVLDRVEAEQAMYWLGIASLRDAPSDWLVVQPAAPYAGAFANPDGMPSLSPPRLGPLRC